MQAQCKEQLDGIHGMFGGQLFLKFLVTVFRLGSFLQYL